MASVDAAGDPFGWGGIPKPGGCKKPGGSIAFCPWPNIFALLYVTLHRSPLGPMPSCLTVLPMFGGKTGWPKPGSGGRPIGGGCGPSPWVGVPSGRLCA
jgi:hypothetical protein